MRSALSAEPWGVVTEEALPLAHRLVDRGAGELIAGMAGQAEELGFRQDELPALAVAGTAPALGNGTVEAGAKE